MDFLSSGVGRYFVQTVFHSAIIVLVVEAIINIWRINKPSVQIKFRLLALLLPALTLPLYYLAYPERTNTYFQEQIALIDFSQWLRLRLGGGVAIWHLFIALLALTTFFFVVREAIPGTRHYLQRRHHTFPVIREGQFPKLDSAMANLARMAGHPIPAVSLSPSNYPIIHTVGRKALVVSSPTMDLLDDKELESVIAHELAHMTRQVSALNWSLPALRCIMFYNPVALLVFRHIVSDIEKICDDIAISISGKRLAVASGLLKIFQNTQTGAYRTISPGRKRRPSFRADVFASQAHVELVKKRVKRLLHPESGSEARYENFRFAVTAVLLVTLLFFVV